VVAGCGSAASPPPRNESSPSKSWLAKGVHVSNIPVQPATIPGFDWAGTITPAVIALPLIALIVVLHKFGLDRRIIRPSRS
jgi:hypothetical protein